MGAVLIKTGHCPLGWTDDRCCLRCPFGSPSWCHFPFRHHEVDCGHQPYRVHQFKGDENHADTRSPATFL